MEKLMVPWGWNRKSLLAGFLTLSGATGALAQSPPVPEPSVPPPAVGGAAPAAVDSVIREAALEARIQQLEAMMQQMSAQMSRGAAPAASSPDGSVNAGRGDPGGLGTTAAPSASGGYLAPGQSSPPNPPPNPRFNMPYVNANYPVTGKFGPGLEFKTADEEFVLQFHNLTQIDYRGYQQGGQTPVHDTWDIPRQWFMFSGRITKPWEYFLSIQNTVDTVNMLDVFLNAHYDDRVQFKVGRYKTPFTYEFYTEPIQGLISPERSLFFNNFALNRSLGGMVWGRLFNQTAPLDYAVGIFNADRNSYVATSDSKEILAFLNWRPFALLEGSPLENFVFGGSVMAGTSTGAPNPASLRTAVATSGNVVLGVPFLSFNTNARESGPRAYWDLHAAWYHKHLSLIAEWQSGYQDYALATSISAHNRVGIESYYVQAGYFITGETVSGRNVVTPIKNFDVRKGKQGPGAIELTARFNPLDLTKNIFTSGLADGNLWTNNLYVVEPGFNWYLTQYTKVTFSWQHSVFGNPVQYNATSLQKTSDLFLLRFQLYF
jgi:phosphate-selective porin OprO and OprP